jgi:hypothetical protein
MRLRMHAQMLADEARQGRAGNPRKGLAAGALRAGAGQTTAVVPLMLSGGDLLQGPHVLGPAGLASSVAAASALRAGNQTTFCASQPTSMRQAGPASQVRCLLLWLVFVSGQGGNMQGDAECTPSGVADCAS